MKTVFKAIGRGPKRESSKGNIVDLPNTIVVVTDRMVQKVLVK